jgi:hypothetical protein
VIEAGRTWSASINLINNTPVSISSPELGISERFLYANSTQFRVQGPSPVDQARRFEVTLPPLVPGTYRIKCDCHGTPGFAEIQ